MIWLPAGRLTEKTVINSTVQNMFRLQTFWMLRSQPEFIHLTRKWKAYQNVREIIAAVKPTSLLTSKYFSQELTTHLTLFVWPLKYFILLLPISSSFWRKQWNRKKKTSLRIPDEVLKLLAFHLSQILEEDYRLGQEGNVGEHYQVYPYSTLKDIFSTWLC